MIRRLVLCLFLWLLSSLPAFAWQIHKSGISIPFLFMTSSDITTTSAGGFLTNGFAVALAIVEVPSPVSGTATQLFASASAAYTGTFAFTVNGVDSGSTCSMSGTTTCNTALSSIPVSVGDLIATHVTGSGTARGVRAGVLITGAATMGMTFTARGAVPAGGATNFIGAGTLTVLGDERSTVPITGNMVNWKFVTPTGVHSGIDYAITVIQNGSASSVTCTISSGTQSCTAAGPLAVTAGDAIDIQVVGTGSGTTVSISGSAQVTTTPASNSHPILQMIQDGSGTSVFGYWRGNATESTAGGLPVPVACTAQKMYIASRLSSSSVYTFRQNAGNTGVTCTGALSCNDTTHTVSLSAGDLIDVFQSSGTPAQWGASLLCQ
jgi:hypothetical protein